MDILNTTEAATVLCLLMLSANNENKPEEIGSILVNPFFIDHVSDKLGPPKDFIEKYNLALEEQGKKELERKTVATLKGAYPAFRIKTLALMTLIAGADEKFDQPEKELIARVSTGLGITMQEIEPEVRKMKNVILKNDVQPNDDES